MSLLLARIDDRLIHQQVVDGCCGSLPAKRLILASDTVAGDSAARAVFATAGSPGVVTEILTVAAAVPRLEELGELGGLGGLESTILVTEDAADMLRLVDAGVPITAVTVGGMHRNPQRRTRLWNEFFLGSAERRTLLELQDRGIHVVFQTVPGAAGRTLGELVAGRGST